MILSLIGLIYGRRRVGRTFAYGGNWVPNGVNERILKKGGKEAFGDTFGWILV